KNRQNSADLSGFTTILKIRIKLVNPVSSHYRGASLNSMNDPFLHSQGEFLHTPILNLSHIKRARAIDRNIVGVIEFAVGFPVAAERTQNSPVHRKFYNSIIQSIGHVNAILRS